MNFDELSLTFAMDYDILKTEFENQGHSGMSAGLMFGMLTRFCPNGRMLVQMLREF